MKTSIIFKLIVFVTCLTCALRLSAQQQQRDSYYDPEITLVLIDKDSIEHFVDLQMGADGGYTTTYSAYNEDIWGYDYVPFYFLINGVRYGFGEAGNMQETVLSYAMQNPLEEGAEGNYCVPMNCTYTLGVAVPWYGDGYYVYAAASYTVVNPGPFTIHSNYDFYIDGFYYHKKGSEVSVTYDSINVDFIPDIVDYLQETYSYQPVYDNQSYSKTVTIPDHVIHNGITYEVSEIGHRAFFANPLVSFANPLDEITIPTSIKRIDSDAFYEGPLRLCNLVGEGSWKAGSLCTSPVLLTIGRELTAIEGLNVAPDEIFCHATTPPICDERTFWNYDGILHVPATSLAAYFTAPYWCNFSDIRGDVDNVEPPVLKMNIDSLTVGCYVDISDLVFATLEHATGDYENHEISYYSSNCNVLDYEGYTLSPGECDYVAQYNNLYAYCHITVVDVHPVIKQDTLQLYLNETSTLTTEIIVPNDVIYYNENIMTEWLSLDPDVATVSNGLVTGVYPGECDIVLYSYYDYRWLDICHVIVNEPVVQISLDQNEASVLPNHIITLTPTMTPITTELVVASSNPAVAAARMINDKIQVVGISEGETTITVSSSDGLAIPGTCLVTVYTEVGDADCDGYITINDVSLLIDYLLSDDDSSIKLLNADVDADGEVSISDVGALIDILLLM